MTPTNSKSWRLNRQINLSVIVQLVGSWVNLQRQLDILQRDVSMLLQSQNSIEQKLESLWTKSISYEYRLQAVEKRATKSEETF